MRHEVIFGSSTSNSYKTTIHFEKHFPDMYSILQACIVAYYFAETLGLFNIHLDLMSNSVLMMRWGYIICMWYFSWQAKGCVS